MHISKLGLVFHGWISKLTTGDKRIREIAGGRKREVKKRTRALSSVVKGEKGE